MLNRLIMMLLILLFASQTVASIYDAHESHQSGEDHLAFEAEHSDHHDQDALSHDDGQIDYDCHHCCHCHGSAPVMTLIDATGLTPANENTKRWRVNQQQISRLISPDLRPPIA